MWWPYYRNRNGSKLLLLNGRGVDLDLTRPIQHSDIMFYQWKGKGKSILKNFSSELSKTSFSWFCFIIFFFKFHLLKMINLASKCFTLISITVSGIVYVISLVTTSQHDLMITLWFSQSLNTTACMPMPSGAYMVVNAPVICKHGTPALRARDSAWRRIKHVMSCK